MPIPLPNLDDRSFGDLVEEGKRLIPGLAPSWTDHNPSDPGITFIELFAFVSEMLLFRADRVSEDNKRAFVKLLRGPGHILKEPIEEEIRLAVLELRDEQRAVTPKDFESLAENFSENVLDKSVRIVARAHCLPRRNLASSVAGAANQDAPAHVSVVIVPRASTSGQPPIADKILRDKVYAYLAPRCLLTTRLHVASARYLKIAVNITAYAFADQDEKKVKSRIEARLDANFHPLTGGPSGRGWPFGQAIYVSDLYALLDGVEGVDYVVPKATKRELIAINDSTPMRAIVEIVEGAAKFVGLRLEPDELVYFDFDPSTTLNDIKVVRQTTLIPEE